MTAVRYRNWLATYALPTLLLLGSLGIMALTMDDPDILWMFIVAPPIAILTGFMLRPGHVWITPLAVAIVLATVAVVAGLVFDVDVSRPLAMHYVWTLQYIGVPLLVLIFIGKSAPTFWEALKRDRERERSVLEHRESV